MDVSSAIAPIAGKLGATGKPGSEGTASLSICPDGCKSLASATAESENATENPFMAMLAGLLASAEAAAATPPAGATVTPEAEPNEHPGTPSGNSTPFISKILQPNAAQTSVDAKAQSVAMNITSDAKVASNEATAPTLAPRPETPTAPAAGSSTTPRSADGDTNKVADLLRSLGLKPAPTETESTSPKPLKVSVGDSVKASPTAATVAESLKTSLPPTPTQVPTTGNPSITRNAAPALAQPAPESPLPSGSTPSVSIASTTTPSTSQPPVTPTPLAPDAGPPATAKRSAGAEAALTHAAKLTGTKTAPRPSALAPTATPAESIATAESASVAPTTRGSTTASTTPAPTLALHRADAPAQLGAHIAMMAQRNLQNATIQLDPVELGPIQIRLSMTGQDQLQIQFQAHHAQTRDSLEQHLPRLRETLTENGFANVDVDVSGQQHSQRQHLAEFEQPWRPHQASEPEADGTVARLVAGARSRDRVDIFA